MFKFSMSQWLDKPEQPQLLPGRMPIKQRTERAISLKQNQNFQYQKILYFQKVRIS